MTNLKNIHALILDMDGVIWQDQKPIGDLVSIFDQIKALEIQIIFASNNSTYSAENFQEKLSRFGVFFQPWQVIGSAEVTALYLKHQFPDGGPIYLVGEEGLRLSLNKCGFYHQERDVLSVIVGFDRQLTYQKLAQATLLIRDGVPFIGTNPDRTYPTPAGQVPGAGSIIGLVEIASGIPPVYMGKPGKAIYQVCLERLNTAPEETLTVGDRLETDIAGGQEMGCPTALVLSGVTINREASLWRPNIDWIGADLTALVNQIALEKSN